MIRSGRMPWTDPVLPVRGRLARRFSIPSDHSKRRLALVAALASWLGACVGTPRPGYEPRSVEARDRVRAEALCDRAEGLMAGRPSEAEALLLEALDADIFSGRAHNNLGVVYLERGDLYEAAGEFEWARKLLPDNPDPRINLGLTLERAGRIDEAIDCYTAANDLRPDHLGAMQALVRAQVRYSRADDRTGGLLDQIALRGEPDWREWAITQRVRRGR